MAEVSIQKFEFTKDWTNPTDFPTFQPDEKQVREDQQELHNQTRDFINNVLLAAVIKVISDNQEYVQQAVADAILGTVPDGSVGIEKLACVASALVESDAAKLPTAAAVAAYLKQYIAQMTATSYSEENLSKFPTFAAVKSYVSDNSIDEAELSVYVSENAAPPIVHGTSDVTDGSTSPYPEGTLYVVLD